MNMIRHDNTKCVCLISMNIKIIYDTIKYARSAHLIYVINILVSVYAVNLSHRVRRAFSNSLPRGPARFRVIYLRYHR